MPTAGQSRQNFTNLLFQVKCFVFFSKSKTQSPKNCKWEDPAPTLPLTDRSFPAPCANPLPHSCFFFSLSLSLSKQQVQGRGWEPPRGHGWGLSVGKQVKGGGEGGEEQENVGQGNQSYTCYDRQKREKKSEGEKSINEFQHCNMTAEYKTGGGSWR